MNKLHVVMVNGFQESNQDNQWYPKMFWLTTDSVESFECMGCVYESSFKEAKVHGILPSSLRRGMCSVDIYSKKDGVWL